jgi:hypothetical protein
MTTATRARLNDVLSFKCRPETYGEEILADLKGMYGIEFPESQQEVILEAMPDPISICPHSMFSGHTCGDACP